VRERRERFSRWVAFGGAAGGVILAVPPPKDEHPFFPALRYPAGFLAGLVLGAGVGWAVAPVFIRE